VVLPAGHRFGCDLDHGARQTHQPRDLVGGRLDPDVGRRVVPSERRQDRALTRRDHRGAQAETPGEQGKPFDAGDERSGAGLEHDAVLLERAHSRRDLEREVGAGQLKEPGNVLDPPGGTAAHDDPGRFAGDDGPAPFAVELDGVDAYRFVFGRRRTGSRRRGRRNRALALRLEVESDGVGGRAIELQPAIDEVERARTEDLQRVEIVRDEQQRAARRGGAGKVPDALAPEREVADRERLVDHEQVGLELGGNRETEPGAHPGAVGADRRVDHRSEPREIDDGPKQRVARIVLEPEQTRGMAGVVATGESGVESETEIGDRRLAAVHFDRTGIGRHPPLDDAQQGRLAGAVRAEHRDAVAAFERERDVVEGPELAGTQCGAALRTQGGAADVGEGVQERAPWVAAELLAHAVHPKRRRSALGAGGRLVHGNQWQFSN